MSIQTRVSHLIYNLLPTDISAKTWHSSCSKEGYRQETAHFYAADLREDLARLRWR